MALKIIVSYDDTDNDRDALALGRLLAISGAELSLAYVRHSFGGALEEKQADELLARGAASVGTPDMPRHVVVNPGTSVGLAELAEREGADIIVFGSEYRTAVGTVKPGISAHKLLLGGPSAIAVAPAGLREHPSVSVNTVGVIDEGDTAARATADGLAAALGASVTVFDGAPVDLLVVGSRPEAPEGKVVLSASSDYAVEAATYPVLVVPRAVTIRYGDESEPPGCSGSAGLPRQPRMTAAISGSRPSSLAFASAQPIALPPCPATTSAVTLSGESVSTRKASGTLGAGAS